jgi:uncharacterized protein YjbI with pentapeptide repeats
MHGLNGVLLTPVSDSRPVGFTSESIGGGRPHLTLRGSVVVRVETTRRGVTIPFVHVELSWTVLLKARESMANSKHVSMLMRGVPAWNRWRKRNPNIRPDLSGFRVRDFEIPLLGLDLRGANLTHADLRSADLYRSWLVGADLTKADLRGAVLGEVTAGGAWFRGALLRAAVLMSGTYVGADFRRADFVTLAPEADAKAGTAAHLWWNKPTHLNWAKLEKCNFSGARIGSTTLDHVDLTDARLTRADLRGATLNFVTMVRTHVEDATFRGCSITGLTAYDLRGVPRDESQLLVTGAQGLKAQVDFLEAAQFISLLRSERLGVALDRIEPKLVLILGRFKPERKRVLEELRDAMTATGWVALVFDFPAPKGITPTFKVMAAVCGWVIADVTDASEVRNEIAHIAREHPSVPIRPILQDRRKEWLGLNELRKTGANIAPTFRYRDTAHLLASIDEALIAPVRDYLDQLTKRRLPADR